MSRLGAFILVGGLAVPLLLAAAGPSVSPSHSEADYDPRRFWAAAPSGLLSPVAAAAQIKRVAAYRHLSYAQVRQVVTENGSVDGNIDIVVVNRALDTLRWAN